MRKTSLVLLVSAICFGNSWAQNIPNGAVCSAHSPGSNADSPPTIAAADALCKSKQCYPGPSLGGENVSWLCQDASKHCAEPGGDGRRYGTPACRGGIVYACMDTGVGVRARFAPVGNGDVLCHPPASTVGRCASSGRVCSLILNDCGAADTCLRDPVLNGPILQF